MAVKTPGNIAGPLRSLFEAGSMLGLSDEELIGRYLEDWGPSSSAAFSALVERHGPMVLRVCRSIARDDHEALDAFQLAFVALARRAGSIRSRGSVGPWLHGAAARVARKARARLVRRRLAEARHADRESVAGSYAVDTRPIDTWPELHEEVARLPARYRDPIVLCYLEGRTHEEAAALLGWPVGTVKGRLSRARDHLRDRLIRRGLAPTVAALSAPSLARSAPAIAPQLLRATLATAAVGSGRSLVPAGAVPAVSSLMEGVFRMLALHPAKAAGFAVVTTLGLTFGPGLSAPDPGEGVESGPSLPPLAWSRSTPDDGQTGERADSAYTLRVYPTLDLISKPDNRPDVEPLIQLITSAIAPGSWRGRDLHGRPIDRDTPDASGSIGPMPGSIGLTIRHSEAVHQEVDALLRRLRRLGEPESRLTIPGGAGPVIQEDIPPLDAILSLWESAGKGSRSLQVEFSRVERSAGGGEPVETRGRLRFDPDAIAELVTGRPGGAEGPTSGRFAWESEEGRPGFSTWRREGSMPPGSADVVSLATDPDRDADPAILSRPLHSGMPGRSPDAMVGTVFSFDRGELRRCGAVEIAATWQTSDLLSTLRSLVGCGAADRAAVDALVDDPTIFRLGLTCWDPVRLREPPWQAVLALEATTGLPTQLALFHWGEERSIFYRFTNIRLDTPIDDGPDPDPQAEHVTGTDQPVDILERWERQCREAKSVLVTFERIDEDQFPGERTRRGQAHTDFEGNSAISFAWVEGGIIRPGRRTVWRDGKAHELDEHTRQVTIYSRKASKEEPSALGLLRNEVLSLNVPSHWDRPEHPLGFVFRFDREVTSKSFGVKIMPAIGGQSRVMIHPLTSEGRASFWIAVVMIDEETG